MSVTGTEMDKDRFISPLGYEHAITIGWNEHNARRHALIELKRSRALFDDEAAELAELQWLAGIKRELQTGPIQTDDNSPERIRVIVRPGKDDWIGVAYSSSVEPNDVIREYVRPDVRSEQEERLEFAADVGRNQQHRINELERIVKLLLGYVGHRGGCSSYTSGPCTCGFESAMRDPAIAYKNTPVSQPRDEKADSRNDS